MDYFSVLVLVVAVVLVFLFLAYEYIWASYESSDLLLWVMLFLVWMVTIALYVLYIIRYSVDDRCELEHDLKSLCLCKDVPE